MSVRGTLSRLSAAVDLSQYRLIRGLLSYNIGESLDDVDVLANDTTFNTSAHSAAVRKHLSISIIKLFPWIFITVMLFTSNQVMFVPCCFRLQQFHLTVYGC